jgi:hypothetical protein
MRGFDEDGEVDEGVNEEGEVGEEVEEEEADGDDEIYVGAMHRKAQGPVSQCRKEQALFFRFLEFPPWSQRWDIHEFYAQNLLNTLSLSI